MTKYHCTVIFDASAGVTVEADTPEDAAEQAENETQGRQNLCHQCSNDLETGDSIGVLVYNESYTDELLDTRYKPQRTWVGLTPEETLDWLAQRHFDECREERPIQNWIRIMKSQLPKGNNT